MLQIAAVQTSRHPQDASPPTFDTVWEGLQEVKQILKDNAEQQKETNRIVKEAGKRLGDFTNSFGDVVEQKKVKTIGI